MADDDLFAAPAAMRLDAVDHLGLHGEQRIAGLVTGAGYPDALAPVVAACRDLDGPVCDIGAGLGAASAWLAGSAGVTVIAVEPEGLAATLGGRAFERMPFMVATATAVPWQTGTAAAVTFLGAVSLLADLAAAFSEAARIVRPGGLLAVTDLATVGRRTLRTGDNHFRSVDELGDQLREHGFDVDVVWQAPATRSTSWTGTIERVDEEMAHRHEASEAFADWRRDRDRLGQLIRDGALELATLVATRQRS